MNTATSKVNKDSLREKFGKKRKSKDKSESSVKPISLDDNKVYEVLGDETIPADERLGKIVELLTLDVSSEESVDANSARMKETMAIIKQLIQRFTEHNRKSIQLTRDNPLGELKAGIQQVFDNYHQINAGRDDLKGRLGSVDDILREVGGEENLVKAMLSAKDQEATFKELDDHVNAAITAYDDSMDEYSDARANAHSANNALNEHNDSFFSRTFSGSVGAELQKKATEATANMNAKKAAKKKASDAVDVKLAEQTKIKESTEFQAHQKILGILDIASEEFKEQLKTLAEATLTYIDDTETVMTEVRNQLELLKKDVDTGLDVNVNIREHVTILSNALDQASDKSSKELISFKETNNKEQSSVAKLNNEKVIRKSDAFIADINNSMASSSIISSEVHKSEVVLGSLKDQLNDGLNDADEQLILAVNTASTSGMVMLNRAQTLGTLAQAIVARGQYMHEAEETFGQMAQEFERSLAAKQGRNLTLSSLSEVISDISDAMDTKNDITSEITAERRDLINDLNSKIRELRQIAEESQEIETMVNVG